MLCVYIIVTINAILGVPIMDDRNRILNSLIISKADAASGVGLIIMRSVAGGNALRM